MRNRNRAAPTAAVIAVLLVLTSCTQASEPSAASTRSAVPATSTPGASAQAAAVSPAGNPRAVATRLDAPWSVAFRNGTALVSERDTARILELTGDGRSRVLATVDGVASSGEGGLLGIAVDPQGRLYVYSTARTGNRIERYDVTGTPGSLGLGARTTLVDRLPSGILHDGGRIAFGPDGMLYATVGDGGQRGRAQDLGSLGGKILRMTPDGAVPGDNPFPGSLVYSYGHRNSQGLAWAADGRLFATEFGQNTWDELNVIVPGGNYGWPTVEGITRDQRFIDPVQQWTPGDASPSGMALVDGTLFIANLRGEVLRSVPVANPGTSTEYYSGVYGRLRDVNAGPDGALWLVTSNTDGRGKPRSDDDRVLRVGLSR